MIALKVVLIALYSLFVSQEPVEVTVHYDKASGVEVSFEKAD